MSQVCVCGTGGGGGGGEAGGTLGALFTNTCFNTGPDGGLAGHFLLLNEPTNRFKFTGHIFLQY